MDTLKPRFSLITSQTVGNYALLFGGGVPHLKVINKKMISTKRYFRRVTSLYFWQVQVASL